MKDNLTPPKEAFHVMRCQLAGWTGLQVLAPMRSAMLGRKLALLALLGICLAEAVAIFPWAAEAAAGSVVNGSTNILSRGHLGRITQITSDGLTVNLRDGGTQVVEFNEIWRIRRAFAANEPPGTTVIDVAHNRLFVETRLSDVIANVSRGVPLTKLTAPNGEGIYLAAAKIIGVSNALPELHNPLCKTVIGTHHGVQQVLEPVDATRRIIAEAHVTP
jgi:hypothetical protein